MRGTTLDRPTIRTLINRREKRGPKQTITENKFPFLSPILDLRQHFSRLPVQVTINNSIHWLPHFVKGTSVLESFGLTKPPKVGTPPGVLQVSGQP